MTRSLSTLTQTAGIAPASQREVALTGRFHNALEPIPGNFRRCALSAAHEPSPEQRRALEARRDAIDAGLHGCEPAVVKRAVGLLRSVMASQSAGQTQLELALAAFLGVLTRFPGWAVEEACQRFLDGRAGGGVYAPTPAEIAGVCRVLVAEPLTERARINAVLDAEVYHVATDAERAKVAAIVEQFKADRTPVVRRARCPDARDPQPEAVEPARDALKGLKLSDASIARGVKIEKAEPTA